MRTTINLDESFIGDLKQLAAKTGRTMTSIIEDAIRRRFSPKNLLPETDSSHGSRWKGARRG